MIEKLRAYGADVDSGLHRCMDNEDMYLRLVRMSIEDGNFDRLFAAMEAGDLDAGFEAAHALKGVTGNLSLDPLFEPLSEMTELLRARTVTDYATLTAAVKEKLAELKELLAE